MKRQSNTERIGKLFDEVKELAPAEIAKSAWFSTLKKDALRKNHGWKRRLEAYLQGLHNTKSLSSQKLAELCNSMAICSDDEMHWQEMVLVAVWILCVATVTIALRTYSIDGWFVLATGVLMTAVGAAWAYQRWKLDTDKSGWQRWYQPAGITFWAATWTAVALFISFFAGEVAQKSAIARFKSDSARFQADPNGFPMIREFARVNFGVDVVLGDAEDSWSTTALNLPGASSASMSSSQGYCLLSMYRSNVLRSFAPQDGENAALWIQGVMMHELGHCLDISRDLPQIGGHTVHTYSIAPVDASGVTDVQSYVAATRKSDTKLWREALADTLEIGFWRLAAPGEAADMTANLRRKRTASAETDDIHATMCWIDHAWKADKPASTKDLLAWADRQRATAACSTKAS